MGDTTCYGCGERSKERINGYCPQCSISNEICKNILRKVGLRKSEVEELSIRYSKKKGGKVVRKQLQARPYGN